MHTNEAFNDHRAHIVTGRHGIKAIETIPFHLTADYHYMFKLMHLVRRRQTIAAANESSPSTISAAISTRCISRIR